MNDFLYLNIILVDFFNIVSCVFKLFVDGTFSLKPVCSPKQKVFKIYIYIIKGLKQINCIPRYFQAY